MYGFNNCRYGFLNRDRKREKFKTSNPKNPLNDASLFSPQPKIEEAVSISLDPIDSDQMAEVAAAPIYFPNPGGDGSKTKRNSTSVSRGKQLKRRNNNAVELLDQSPPAILKCSRVVVDSELSRLDTVKNRRLDGVFQNRKPSSTMKSLFEKLHHKANSSENEKSKGSFLPSNPSQEFRQELNSRGDLAALTSDEGDSASQQCRTIKNCSEKGFLSVTELALGESDQKTSSTNVDVQKAWNSFACHGPSDSGLPFNSFEKRDESRSRFPGATYSELHVSRSKVPLDLTLKTAMRIVSSSPVSWFHRLLMSSTYSGMAALPTKFSNDHDTSGVSNPLLAVVDYRDKLSSWIYPQTSLPSSVIAFLSSAKGGAGTDFLSKRHQDWEESFQNLYYKLRQSACDIFYVCTSQFVVMFTVIGAGGKTKRKCNAYISQSTRSLRSLLKEQDVCFSMPLCLSEVEQTSREDLVELSEIEKKNLGQAKWQNIMAAVDNSPQSLLAFEGNHHTHGLYDFLLNYKFFLPALAVVDVPVLCAPLPFRNAALSVPEVTCKEIKSIDYLASKFDGPKLKDDTTNIDSSTGVCYIIEIKDPFITPWAMASICAAIGSEDSSFEASFTVEPNSLGLNVALDAFDQKADLQDDGESNGTYGPRGIAAEVASELRSSWIKGLKCCNGHYTASLSPI
ncbi:hypothetical protein Droror1_Dr00026045 [Drosera rotundifolia]